MKSFSSFLTESIHPNLIEYLTREVYKKKNLTRALNYVYKKFNGSRNMFLGGEVSFTVEELKDAFYRDKAQTAKSAMKRYLPGKEHMAIESVAAQFFLDINTLKRYVESL